VTFTSAPSGAKVLIDGSARGSTPLTLSLDYGTYTIDYSLDGHLTAQRTVDVRVAELSVPLTLEPKGATGSVLLLYPGKGFQVSVDGGALRALPAKVELSEGPHRFVLENASGDRFDFTQEIVLQGAITQFVLKPN
jgi:hypothetical protein